MAIVKDRAIAMTGASSGIGAALAIRLARHPGMVLALSGRDPTRLGAVAERCRALGAMVETAVFDTRDRPAVTAWLQAFDAAHGLDCVIANAGVSAGALPGGHPEKADQIHEIFDINLGGALNAVVPALGLMQARGRGRIVLVSSLSAYAPLPGAAAYSGSKAALLAFALALRQTLKPVGIRINVVVPGFVATPMSQSFRGWKPFEIGAGAAARRIEAGLAADRRAIVFPWPLAVVCRLSAFVPEWISDIAMRLFRL